MELHCACARASPWLWLTPYFGHHCATVVDDFVTSGEHVFGRKHMRTCLPPLLPCRMVLRLGCTGSS